MPEPFDETVESIRSEYEDTDIMNLGAEGSVEAETISTGSMGLDKAIQAGGVPKGRITEVFGKAGVGKCLDKETYVKTDSGLETIEELFQRADVVPSCTTKVSGGKFQVENKHGDLEDIGEFVNNNRRKVYEVKTESGVKIKATANHPFQVINKHGFLVWKELHNLTKNDYVTQRRDGNFGKKSLNNDVAYFIGTLIADGHYTETRVEVTNDDSYVKDKIRNIGNQVFNTEPKEYNQNNKGSIKFHFNNKQAVQRFYRNYNYSSGVAKDKKISKELRKLDRESTKHLIRGYMDSEAHFGDKGITVVSASHELLYQLKLLLQNFGIIATLKEKDVNDYPDNQYYRIFITGNDFIRYKSFIGSENPKIKKRLKRYSPKGDQYDSIPNLQSLIRILFESSETSREEGKEYGSYKRDDRNISYQKLEQLVDDDWESSKALERLEQIVERELYFDKIESIEPAGNIPTFDLHLPETHSFNTNGIITHNTSLALHILANAQKNSDSPSVFVDAEHALDMSYAEALGVDTDRTYISQPNSGEKALGIVQMICDGGGADVVVIDSVAALTPEAELKGDVGESQVGLQARLMSQAMRKLRGVVRQRDTALIFINQLRANINTNNPFGPQSTTTGGRALKYYTAVRIKLWYAGKIEKNNEKIGNRIGAEVVKNKLGPPHRKTKFDLMYGKGIVKERELIDRGKDKGIIKVAGSWYKYQPENGDKETLGQGKEDAAKTLIENEELAKEIEDRIMEE